MTKKQKKHQKAKEASSNQEPVNVSKDSQKIAIPVKAIKWVVIAIAVLLVLLIAFLAMGRAEKVEVGDTVSLWYTGKDSSGAVFDTNVKEVAQASNLTKTQFELLTFKLGEKSMIPGFENGIMGMKVGQKKVIFIEPEDGYGLYKADLVKTYTMEEFKKSFPTVNNVSVGKLLPFTLANGYRGVAKIKASGSDFVSLDFNHMLAGKKLTFEVEIISIE